MDNGITKKRNPAASAMKFLQKEMQGEADALARKIRRESSGVAARRNQHDEGNNQRTDTMIYLTGDTHIPVDIDKLSTTSFPEQKQMTRDDFVIVLGDFGLLWREDKTYRYWLDILSHRRYTLLFIDGNHENFDWLNSLPVESWHGGHVHRIAENILHLMRGEVFEIDGSTFFTLGGAVSHDHIYRTESISWWPQEVPSKAEIDHAIDNLAGCGNQVDYVLTHTCPLDALSGIRLRMNNWDGYADRSVEKALQTIKDTIHYRDWYFGHWHMDFDDNHFHAMYNRIVRLQ